MTSRTPSRQSSVEEEKPPGPLTRLLLGRQSSRRRKARSSSVKKEQIAAEIESRDSDRDKPVSPSGSGAATPTRSRSKKFTGFASRSLRKSQWRLFKHRTFFGSRASTKTKSNNQLQLPRLTLRHPSVDGTAMPLAIDGDESEFIAIRDSQRRWTESESSGRLRDSRDSSSGYDGSHDPLEEQQAMTAPVSPSVPLSASSSQSEGWKYNSQRLLFKLKTHRLGYIAGFSHTNSSTSSSTDSAWKSLDSQTWRHSLDDKEITLRGAQLETICDAERHALQLIATQKLAKTLPGINLKKETSLIRQKRQKFTKGSRTLTASDVTRRPSGSSTDALDEKKVFGVSLVDCMQNDRLLDMESRCRSLDDSAVCLSLPRSQRSSCGSKSVRSEPEIVSAVDESKRWLYPSTQNLYPGTSSQPSSPSPMAGSAPPTCSLPIKESSSLANHLVETTGRFIKKQRPSSASFSYSLDNGVEDIDPHTLRVPRIVENCTQYLMTYGLNAVGLFRVAGNTKRCRQLRLALERVGGGVAIGDDMVENTTPHDVATLLKEYFRDLPQSLLPKEHYQAYIAASKITALEERIDCFRFLIALLSPPSVDSLFVLLKFLHEVAENAADRDSTEDGEVVLGNKMDAKNLATIFAPCILRPDHDKTAAILQENDMQVSVLETMITHVEEMFRIPRDLQCKIFNKLRETEPMRLDRILDQIARAEGYVDHPLQSPFPAMVEEDSPREKTPERHPNGKIKVSSQRSGSWPFSLRSPKPQRFFPNDDSVNPSTSSTVSATDDFSVVNTADCSSKKEQLTVSTPVSARSPSRERDLRRAAAAARRRLQNVAAVVRAFRFSSVTRSSPNVSSSGSNY